MPGPLLKLVRNAYSKVTYPTVPAGLASVQVSGVIAYFFAYQRTFPAPASTQPRLFSSGCSQVGRLDGTCARLISLVTQDETGVIAHVFILVGAIRVDHGK